MRKKRRDRIRKSTKYAMIIVSIILIMISSFSLYNNILNKNIKEKTKEIYKYTNKFNYDYKVNLLDNKFITNEEIDEDDKSFSYVTDLIDKILLDVNYNYEADKESNLNISYSIIGKMSVNYLKDDSQQKIWEETDNLLEEKNISVIDNQFKINEKIEIDLKDRNKLIHEFEDKIGIIVNAKYKVFLKINVETNVEEKDINFEYEPLIQISLGEKTTEILGENNLENTEYISKIYKVNSTRNVFIMILDVIIIFISIKVLRYATKSKAANRVKNEYRKELNRILKICEDKIVQVNSPIVDSKEIVIVKDFGEILKVSEELFKPILYYFDKDQEIAYFSVISENNVYRFILKR